VSQPDLQDLPSLAEWGDRLRDATERLEAEDAAPAPQRRRRGRLPAGRLGIAVAAAFVLVPGAVATRSIWDDPVQRVDPARPDAATPGVRLVEGRTGVLQWRVGGYDAASGQRCLTLETFRGAGHSTARGCSLPETAARIASGSYVVAGVGFVYGAVDSAVRTVEVTVRHGRRARVATTAVAPDVLRRSRMRGGFRMFVATFRGGFDPTAPPAIVATDAAGHTVGRVGGPAAP
jgi:hypothetical protein